MSDIMKANLLVSTNHQKVLSYLAKFSDEEFYEREITRNIGISYGSANKVLNDLFIDGLVNRQQRGKMFFYSINSADSSYQFFKILNTIILLRPLIKRLKKTARKIVLYGSCAKGTDTSNSDIDIFIISDNKRKVLGLIEKFSLGKGFEEVKIQPVILSPSELLKSEKKGSEFLSLVEEGIVLWEKITDESRI